MKWVYIWSTEYNTWNEVCTQSVWWSGSCFRFSPPKSSLFKINKKKLRRVKLLPQVTHISRSKDHVYPLTLHCFMSVKSTVISLVNLLISMYSLKSLLRDLLLYGSFPYCDPGSVFGMWLPRVFRCSTDFPMQDYNWSHRAWTLIWISLISEFHFGPTIP